MAKYACYCATRNYYDRVIPSLKSLLKNSDVDMVYILAEDDQIGYPLPHSRTKVINVSDQTYILPSSPNYSCVWTYMVMMRAALCHVLPDVGRILSLDCDTIVRKDISSLWNYDLDHDFFAAAREIHRDFHGHKYYNCGVVLFNLKELRTGKADEVLRALNNTRYTYAEQDALNELCEGRITELPSTFNACRFTEPVFGGDPHIRHYAAEREWYDMEPDVAWWRDRKWQEVLT